MNKQVIDFPKLDKTAFSVVSLFDDSDEKVYWWSKTPHQRLQHTELLRRINYGNKVSQPLTRQRFFPKGGFALRLLNAKQVDYLLIGGYAVSYHGYPRATGDMDVWIAIAPENAAKIVDVLREFGFGVPELSEQLFLQENKIIRMGFPPVRIEITTTISGVNFGECYKARVVDTIDGVEVNLISLPDLKINKKASARNKDLNDLEHLP